MHSPRVTGVTLVELIVTIAVLGIVSAAAVPWWSRTIASNHRIAATNRVVGLVQFARSEAIKAHQEVVLCPDNGAGGCLDSDGDWPFGYTMFINDPPGLPWRATAPAHQLARGRWPAAIVVLANRDGFVFRPLARRSTNGTLRVCHERQQTPPRAIIISSTGRRAGRHRPRGAALLARRRSRRLRRDARRQPRGTRGHRPRLTTAFRPGRRRGHPTPGHGGRPAPSPPRQG